MRGIHIFPLEIHGARCGLCGTLYDSSNVVGTSVQKFEYKKPTMTILPTDPEERKRIPIASGFIDYFPAAVAEVAKVSYGGTAQHHPGEELHWDREKSKDHSDTLMRHFLERGTKDADGQRHSTKMVWRALAILQLELEAEGAPIARGAKYPEEKK